MNQPSNNSPNLLDLVFEGRNKKYGAYVLRLQHDKTLLRALLYVVSSLFLLSLTFYYHSKQSSANPANGAQLDPRDFYVVPVEMPPLPDPEPETQQAASPLSETQLARVILDDAPDTGAAVTPTASGGTTAAISQGEFPGTGTAVIVPVPDEQPDSIFESYSVEELPEFEGGINALRRFISSHVHYPADEAERSQEGTVMVRFVVDEKGLVTKVSILRSAGPAFDREAVRVISMLPAFKSPARTKGRAVKVMFALPIKFRVE